VLQQVFVKSLHDAEITICASGIWGRVANSRSNIGSWKLVEQLQNMQTATAAAAGLCYCSHLYNKRGYAGGSKNEPQLHQRHGGRF
jgi:hypothetical protein